MNVMDLTEAALAVKVRDVLRQTVPKLGLRSSSPISVAGKPCKIGDFLVFQQGRVHSMVVLLLSQGALFISPDLRNCSVIHVPDDQLVGRVNVAGRTVDGQRYSEAVVVRTPPASFTTQLLKAMFARLKNGMVRNLLQPTSDRVRLFTGTSNPSYTWKKKIVEALKDARSKYYNDSTAPFTDAEYDYLEALLSELNPSAPILKQIGAPVEKGRKQALPVFMGSLKKVKNGDQTVRKWLKQRAKPEDMVIISNKLDGSSVLLEYKAGKYYKASTRGDGTVGQDVTDHMRLVGGVPMQLSAKVTVKVRGEVIMPKATFNKKYAETAPNPRNLVAGMLNRKVATKGLQDLNFVAHGFYDTKPSLAINNLAKMKRLGFQVVPYTVVPARSIGDNSLSKRMLEQRKSFKYEMDGLVLQISNQRAVDEETTEGNPDFSVAFKDNTSTFNATVGKIEWDISRHGMIKPVVILDPPVKFGGVTISRITAHNAGYVYQEGLGPVAVITATRSGDVIPYVVGVVKKVKPQMPKGDWVWNDTHVDILVKNKNTVTQVVKANAHFFQKLGVDGVSEGITAKLYAGGYTSVPDILNMSVADFIGVDGIQRKLAEKLFKAIHKPLQKVDLPLVAAASGCFDRGIGEARLRVIWKEYGNDMFGWRGWKPSAIAEEVSALPNTGAVVARQFAEGIPAFLRFWKAISKHVVLSKPEDASKALVSSKLEGLSFCFTGFRDDEAAKLITSNGGKVASGVAKGLTLLIAKDPGSGSGKVQKANQLGIKVVTMMQFRTWLKSKGVQ